MNKLLVFFGMGVSCVLTAPAATINILPSQDAVIYEQATGDLANGSGEFLHAGANGPGQITRTLIQFDLAAQMPSGATITGVTLHMRKTNASPSGTLSLYRALSAWNEGSSNPGGTGTGATLGEGGGTTSGPGDVTWIDTDRPTTQWTAPGGDFSATASASSSPSSLVESFTFSDPLLLADVEDMIANPGSNFGWFIRNSAEGTPTTSIQMGSRTNPTPADRPFLEVEYNVVLTPSTPVLYYNFEEGSGLTVNNLGALGGTGILNGLGGDERWVAGRNGGGLKLSGGSMPNADRIHTQLGANVLGLSNTNTYTATAWINYTKTTSDSMVFGQVTADSGVLHLGVRGQKAHMGHWGNDVTGATVLQTGVWHHIVWQYANGEQTIYVNGKRDVTPSVRGVLTDTNELVIGVSRSSAANWGFEGIIDDVAVYNETLSLNQIVFLAGGGAPDSLPAPGPLGDPTYFTAPFGPGGTWNLYQVLGFQTGGPKTWLAAETESASRVDPTGLTSTMGHLADVHSRQENFWLERLANFQSCWIGLTDNELFGGTEAVNNRNGGWVWTSGEPYDYQAWKDLEPNNSTTAGEDAVELATGKWNDNLSGIDPETNAPPSRIYIVEWQTQQTEAIPGIQEMPPILPTDLVGRGPGHQSFGVRSVSNNGTVDNIVRAVASVQSGKGTIVEGSRTTINDSDPQNAASFFGLFPNDTPWVGNTTNNEDQIVHVYKGRVTIPSTGDYTFVWRTDDVGALRIRGQSWTKVGAGDGVIDIMDPSTIYRERGNNIFYGHISLSAGTYDLDAISADVTSTGGHELYAGPGFLVDDKSPDLRLVGEHSEVPLPIPGILFDNGTNWLVRTSSPGGNAVITNLNNLADAQIELDNDPTIFTNTTNEINFSDPDDHASNVITGYYGNDEAFANDTNSPEDDFALEATGTLEIPLDGLYQFGFRGDDGGSLQIVGQTWSNLVFAINGNSVINGDTLVHNALTGNSETRASIYLTAGTYPIRALFWERGGGAYFEVYGDTMSELFPRLLQGNGARVEPRSPGLELELVKPITFAAPTYNPATGEGTISWDSLPGLTYTVEWSTDYLDWTPLVTKVVSQGATTTLILPPNLPENFVVFRILED